VAGTPVGIEANQSSATTQAAGAQINRQYVGSVTPGRFEPGRRDARGQRRPSTACRLRRADARRLASAHYKSSGPKLADSRLAGYVTDALPAAEPLTVPELERAILLANDMPNVTAHATLVPGASVGTSDLVLEANQSGWFSKDTLEADNAGSRYTGPGRYGGSVDVASPAGLGDLLSACVLTSFAGFDYSRLSWTTPLTDTG
jgi:hemolysin activation/secretion protein